MLPSTKGILPNSVIFMGRDSNLLADARSMFNSLTPLERGIKQAPFTVITQISGEGISASELARKYNNDGVIVCVCTDDPYSDLMFALYHAFLAEEKPVLLCAGFKPGEVPKEKFIKGTQPEVIAAGMWEHLMNAAQVAATQ